MLNLSAWLILELCVGRSPDELAAAYREAVIPPLTETDALKQLEVGIELLTRSGIVELATATS